MSSHDARRRADPTMIPDELDSLLREVVRGQMGGAKPPDQVWERIEHQLRGGPSPIRRRASSRARRTAPLVQALALASLVVVFSLSLGQSLSWSLLLEPYGQVSATQTPVAVPDRWSSQSTGASDTDIRQARLLAKERELEQQMSVGALPVASADDQAQEGEDGMLGKRENLQSSRDQATEHAANSPNDLSRMAFVPPRHREELLMLVGSP